MTEVTPITNPVALGVTMTPAITANPQVGQFASNTPEPLPFPDPVVASDVTAATPDGATVHDVVYAPRHPGVTAILRHFEFSHLPEHLQRVSKEFHALAHLMAGMLKDDPELVAGLRKLLEAKDCMVRAARP